MRARDESDAADITLDIEDSNGMDELHESDSDDNADDVQNPLVVNSVSALPLNQKEINFMRAKGFLGAGSAAWSLGRAASSNLYVLGAVSFGIGGITSFFKSKDKKEELLKSGRDTLNRAKMKEQIVDLKAKIARVRELMNLEAEEARQQYKKPEKKSEEVVAALSPASTKEEREAAYTKRRASAWKQGGVAGRKGAQAYIQTQQERSISRYDRKITKLLSEKKPSLPKLKKESKESKTASPTSLEAKQSASASESQTNGVAFETKKEVTVSNNKVGAWFSRAKAKVALSMNWQAVESGCALGVFAFASLDGFTAIPGVDKWHPPFAQVLKFGIPPVTTLVWGHIKGLKKAKEIEENHQLEQSDLADINDLAAHNKLLNQLITKLEKLKLIKTALKKIVTSSHSHVEVAQQPGQVSSPVSASTAASTLSSTATALKSIQSDPGAIRDQSSAAAGLKHSSSAPVGAGDRKSQGAGAQAASVSGFTAIGGRLNHPRDIPKPKKASQGPSPKRSSRAV